MNPCNFYVDFQTAVGLSGSLAAKITLLFSKKQHNFYFTLYRHKSYHKYSILFDLLLISFKRVSIAIRLRERPQFRPRCLFPQVNAHPMFIFGQFHIIWPNYGPIPPVSNARWLQFNKGIMWSLNYIM